MFVFGASYAIASLGCTIGTFVVAVAPTFRDENFISGIASFVLYGLGMGTVVIFLTIATALAKTSLLKTLRNMMPYVNRIAGVLLVPTGLYLAYYGWFALRVQQGRVTRDPIVSFFESIQNNAAELDQRCRSGASRAHHDRAHRRRAHDGLPPAPAIHSRSPRCLRFVRISPATACAKCSTSADRSASWRSTVVHSNESPM